MQRPGLKYRLGEAWLPLAIALVLAAAAIVGSRALTRRENGLIQRTVAAEATAIQDLLLAQMESQILALVRMGHRMDIDPALRREHWEADARLLVGDTPGYQALEWVDPSFHVRWVVPKEGNESDEGLDLGADRGRRRDLERARDRAEIVLSRAIDLKQRGKGFLIHVPVAHEGQFGGFLLAICRIDKLFDSLLREETTRQYALAIFEGDRAIYRSEGTLPAPETPWTVDQQLQLFRVPLRLRVWPKPELLSRLESNIGHVVLAGGLLMSLLLGVSIHFAQIARRRTRRLEAANRELEQQIAERRHAESQIDERTTYLNALIENSPLAIVATDVAGCIRLCNRAFERLFLVDAQQVVGAQLGKLIGGAEKREEAAETASRVAAGETLHLTTRRFRSDGQPVDVEVYGVPLIVQGQVRGAYAFYQDITERKRAEQALAEERDLLHALMDNVPDKIYFKDAASRFIRSNRAHARFMGISEPEQLVGKTDFDILPPAVAAQFYSDEQEIIRSGEPQIGKIRKTTAADGKINWVSVSKVPLRDREGRIVGTVGISRDITERVEAERGLRDSEAELRALFAAMSDIILVLDADGRYVKVAPTNPELLAQPPGGLVGKTLYDVFPPSQADDFLLQMRQALRARRTLNLEYSLPVHGKETWFAARVSPISDNRALWVARDITEHRQLEEQYRQARRMESVGRLAGGIAHDFNNLLTIIKGYSDLLLVQVEPQDRRRRAAEEISKAADRAASLTRQLLAFSRRQVLQPKILDLNQVVGNTEKMLRRLIGEDINLLTHLAPGLDNVKADPGQIEQVIMNLAVNARDAMPGGGTLTIETANVELDEEYARTRHGVIPGAYVLLAISDTGSGMTPEVQAQIFEPFFTTKELGKGTGLGLATVYGIVKQSGGNIWVYSEPNHGTTFKIYLPKAEQAVEPSVVSEERLAPACGTETILLVEDEEMVRTLASDILRRSGYTVLAARNGVETLQLAEQHQGPIHLLVTDVVMPGMSGRELAERLSRRRPGIAVLYMSGYTDDAIVHHGVLDSGTAFLQKPFTADSLARKVREVLHA